MPHESLARTRIVGRLRVLAVGMSSASLLVLYTRLRRECLGCGLTLELQQRDGAPEIDELLAMPRLDLIVLGPNVDARRIGAALQWAARCHPELLGNCRIHVLQQATTPGANGVEVDADEVVAATRPAKGPGTTRDHWADGVRDRPKGARTFIG